MALGGIDVHEVPGEHISMLIKPENSQILAEKLKAIMADFNEQPQCDESAKIRQVKLRQN
jgi:hypothetical protein